MYYSLSIFLTQSCKIMCEPYNVISCSMWSKVMQDHEWTLPYHFLFYLKMHLWSKVMQDHVWTLPCHFLFYLKIAICETGICGALARLTVYASHSFLCLLLPIFFVQKFLHHPFSCFPLCLVILFLFILLPIFFLLILWSLCFIFLVALNHLQNSLLAWSIVKTEICMCL